MSDFSSLRAGDVVVLRDGARIVVTTVSVGGASFWGYYADDMPLNWQRRRAVYEAPAYLIESIDRAA